MPWLEERSGQFLISFRWNGAKYRRRIQAKDRKAADAVLARFVDTLGDVERGRLVIPDGADLATFLLSDGRLSERPGAATTPPSSGVRLRELADEYLAAHAGGALEKTTLLTARIHLNHLVAFLGEAFEVSSLTLADLQNYATDRADDDTRRGTKVSAYTIRKEVKTLRVVWNWARRLGKVPGEFPNGKLTLPKQVEKPPFQTMTEIERRIARGGLTEVETADLWRCLYLTGGEVKELLKHLRSSPAPGFLFPMVATAAFTGARRSELCRAEFGDVDLEGRTIRIREKKRAEGRLTTRTVPISTSLVAALRDWLARHPGGNFLFCLPPGLLRSGKARPAPTPVTVNEAHDHLRRAVNASKWRDVRWHTLRHTFVSNCAASGIDQRMISEWVGHETPEQERRYRHLFPDIQQRAIEQVFS